MSGRGSRTRPTTSETSDVGMVIKSSRIARRNLSRRDALAYRGQPCLPDRTDILRDPIRYYLWFNLWHCRNNIGWHTHHDSDRLRRKSLRHWHHAPLPSAFSWRDDRIKELDRLLLDDDVYARSFCHIEQSRRLREFYASPRHGASMALAGMVCRRAV